MRVPGPTARGCLVFMDLMHQMAKEDTLHIVRPLLQEPFAACEHLSVSLEVHKNGVYRFWVERNNTSSSFHLKGCFDVFCHLKKKTQELACLIVVYVKSTPPKNDMTNAKMQNPTFKEDVYTVFPLENCVFPMSC